MDVCLSRLRHSLQYMSKIPPTGSSTGSTGSRALAVIDSRIAIQIAGTNQQIGRHFSLLQSKIDHLTRNVETLREDNNELRQNLINLHVEYKELRNYAQNASDSAASAIAESRYMERTVERVNILTEILSLISDGVRPIHHWLGVLLAYDRKLNAREKPRNHPDIIDNG
jgi:prefoldin subunit 5